MTEKNEINEVIFQKWLETGADSDMDQLFRVMFRELQQVARNATKNHNEWEDLFQEGMPKFHERLKEYHGKRQIKTLENFKALFYKIVRDNFFEKINRDEAIGRFYEDRESFDASEQPSQFSDLSKHQIGPGPKLPLAENTRRKLASWLKDLERIGNSGSRKSNVDFSLIEDINPKKGKKKSRTVNYLKPIVRVIWDGGDHEIIDLLQKKVDFGISSHSSDFWDSDDWMKIMVWFLDRDDKPETWENLREQLRKRHKKAVTFIKKFCRNFVWELQVKPSNDEASGLSWDKELRLLNDSESNLIESKSFDWFDDEESDLPEDENFDWLDDEESGLPDDENLDHPDDKKSSLPKDGSSDLSDGEKLDLSEDVSSDISAEQQEILRDVNVILSELFDQGGIAWNDHQHFRNVKWTAFWLVRQQLARRTPPRIHGALKKLQVSVDGKNAEEILSLSRALRRLEKNKPKHYPYVIANLLFADNMSEIARALGESPELARYHIKKGKEFLQEELKKQ